MTRYGTDVLLGSLALLLAVLSAVFFFSPWPALTCAVTVLGLILAGLVLNFFRDPERTVPPEGNGVISPADGRIVVVRRTEEREFIGGEAVQISIFMSPLDVHVNRMPVDGVVRLCRHVPGRFVAAFQDKSSELNERMCIGVERPDGSRVFFVQIAGAVARRIVAELKPGQEVRAGERFGMIKFGSRVDVYIPGKIDVRVGLRDRVRAGESVLAHYL